MVSNLAAVSGAALVDAAVIDAALGQPFSAHTGTPAYVGGCAAATKRERFVAPMPAVRPGTRVSAIGDAGNGNAGNAANGTAGTAAAAASRDRCG